MNLVDYIVYFSYFSMVRFYAQPPPVPPW